MRDRQGHSQNQFSTGLNLLVNEWGNTLDSSIHHDSESICAKISDTHQPMLNKYKQV